MTRQVDRIVESLLEAAPGSELYHTTTMSSLQSILRSGKILAAGEEDDGYGDFGDNEGASLPFVSLGEKPHVGPRGGKGVFLVLDTRKIKSQVVKIVYSKGWAEQNPEHASYVAGMSPGGWWYYYGLDRGAKVEDVLPDDCVWEDEGYYEHDEECASQHFWDTVLLPTFKNLAYEREWTTTEPGRALRVGDAIKRIVVQNPADTARVKALLGAAAESIPVVPMKQAGVKAIRRRSRRR